MSRACFSSWPEQGAQLAPPIPALFYRAVAFTLKKERADDPERLLREYLQRAPLRSTFPCARGAFHEWLAAPLRNQQNTGRRKNSRHLLNWNPPGRRKCAPQRRALQVFAQQTLGVVGPFLFECKGNRAIKEARGSEEQAGLLARPR